MNSNVNVRENVREVLKINEFMIENKRFSKSKIRWSGCEEMARL